MAYNADAVRKVSVSADMTVFYAVSSRSLAATPSTVAIQSMHSACFSLQNREPVCLQAFIYLPKIKTVKLMIVICVIGNVTKGLTFEQIAQAMNKDEVWVAALFYGQVSSFSASILRRRTVLYSAVHVESNHLNHGYPKGQSERGRTARPRGRPQVLGMSTSQRLAVEWSVQRGNADRTARPPLVPESRDRSHPTN